MSLPPAKWAQAGLSAGVPLTSQRGKAKTVLLSMLWGARNEQLREPFVARLEVSQLHSGWTSTTDGWTLPLWHAPAPAGGTGEPVILATELGLGPRCFDLTSGRSLVQFLHQRGYDVFVFGHRGHREARPPSRGVRVDFDAISSHDVPAAIQTVLAQTGAKRVLWIGHGFGGQCLVAHMANDGDRDIASAVTLGSPVVFTPLRSTARRSAAIANALPATWRIPLDRVQALLMASSKNLDMAPITRRIEGPMARSLILEGTEPVTLGLIQQMSRWHDTGQLVSKDNHFDYLEGVQGRRCPVLVIGSSGDQQCQIEQARPLIDALPQSEWWALDEGWGHLDLIAGADADRVVFPRISEWLEKSREACWTNA